MGTKNSSVHKNTLLSLALGWTFLILFLCLVRFSDLPSIKVSGIDKYVHFSFHFGFTLLWGIYSRIQMHKHDWKRLIAIVLVSLLYGILIEIMQELFTKTRKADAVDVLANFSGAVTAFLGFAFYKVRRTRNLEY